MKSRSEFTPTLPEKRKICPRSQAGGSTHEPAPRFYQAGARIVDFPSLAAEGVNPGDVLVHWAPGHCTTVDGRRSGDEAARVVDDLVDGRLRIVRHTWHLRRRIGEEN